MTTKAPSSPLRTTLIVAVCILAVEMLGLASARIAGSVALNPWFLALVKPELQPPDAAFGLAWAALYALIGAAFGLVLAAGSARSKWLATVLFGLQLGLNLAWSPLFFRTHRMLDAFWLLVVILFVSGLVTWRFWIVRRIAAVMMVPYLAWLSFAALLTWQIIALNPDGGPTISMGAEAAIPPQQE
jgi:translocator protein